MKWFKQEFSKSNIISGILALLIWGVIAYLSIVQITVPEILYYGGTSALAFFWGSKVGVQGERLRMEVRRLALKERNYDAWIHSE